MDFIGWIVVQAIVFGLATLISAVGALAGLRKLEERRSPGTSRPSTLVAMDIGSSLLLGLGAIHIAAVPGSWYFIHGDSERYQWIIRGPAPFDQFGGGPYQLFLYGGLAVIGIGMCVTGLWLRLGLQRRRAVAEAE